MKQFLITEEEYERFKAYEENRSNDLSYFISKANEVAVEKFECMTREQIKVEREKDIRHKHEVAQLQEQISALTNKMNQAMTWGEFIKNKITKK